MSEREDYKFTIEHKPEGDPIGRIIAIVLFIAIVVALGSCANSILYGEW